MRKFIVSNVSEIHLDAFFGVAMEGSLSKAAKTLHLSQPALTRRLQALEEGLGFSLFKRTSSGVELLESGQKLLQYVTHKRILEDEFLKSIHGEVDSQYSGLIRIAGHSSIIEPIVIPAIAPFLLENPETQVEISIIADSSQDQMLNSSKTDIIFSAFDRKRKDVAQYLLGEEIFICIEGVESSKRGHVYLDETPEDMITFAFLEGQGGIPKNFMRSFLHDENAIMKGVQLGLGRAVKPKHTIHNVEGIREVKGFKPLKNPVYLRHKLKQFYSPLEKQVLEILIHDIPLLISKLSS